MKYLNHPNIVHCLCVCFEPGNHLVVMEYREMSLNEALHVRQIQMKAGPHDADVARVGLLAQDEHRSLRCQVG